MATSSAFASIPSGSFALRFAPGLATPAVESSSKRKALSSQVYGLRYNFKPASITAGTPGALYTENGARQLKFDLAAGGQQVFDAREEASKARECVMIWDEGAQTFTLHPLASTLHLTLNRSASSTTGTSSQAHAPPKPGLALPQIPTRARSSTSSTSSSGAPLATVAKESERTRKRRAITVIDIPPDPIPAKAGRGAKAIPRKQLNQSAAPTVSAGSTKGRGKSGAKKKPPAPAGTKGKATGPNRAAKNDSDKGKVKSSEIIEDSDEEAAVYDEATEEEEEDEFAKLVGQSLAGGLDEEMEDDEDDEEDEEGEDEDEALGGAKVVVEEDGSEWL